MRRLATAICLTAALSASIARADSYGDVRTGNAAFGDGRYEAAVDAFTRAILAGDLPPEALAITFNNRGVAYSELGDFDRAISDCSQALGLAPGDATAIRNLRIAHLRRAAAAARLGDRAAAQADYDRAIELEPTHPLAYLRRGQLALERGDRAAAIADLTKARDLDPANADIAALLADAERTEPAPSTSAEAATDPALEPVPDPEASPEPPAAPTAAAPPVELAPNPEASPEPPGAPTAAAPPVVPDYSIDPPGGAQAERQQAAPSAALAPGAGPVAPAADGAGRAYRALQDVNVRQGPGNDYPRIGSLAQGSTVRVVSERLGWLEVRLAGGGSGYVYRRWLQELGAAGPPSP